MNSGRPDCTTCKGAGFVLVDEWIGPLQGRKDCECIHHFDCSTCGELLDRRDLAQVLCHGLPVPEMFEQYFCLTEEEINEHRNGVLRDVSTGVHLNLPSTR